MKSNASAGWVPVRSSVPRSRVVPGRRRRRRRRLPGRTMSSAASRRAAAAGDRRVGAVGRDEVDQRLAVPQAEPKSIQLSYGASAELPLVCGEERPPRLVERRDAGVPGPRHVERRRGPAAGRAGCCAARSVTNSSISLPGLAGHAAHDVAGRLVGGQRPPSRNDGGLRKASSSGMSRLPPVGGPPGHGLGEHRVAEAVDRVRELGA